MGFSNPQTKIYVTIQEGIFAVRSSESDPKAVKRETKSGSTIWECRYKQLSGRISDLYFKQNDFNGKKWEDLVMVINDGADLYQLSMPFPGKFSLSVLRAIKNAPLDQVISFNPWTKIKDGKTKAALFMNPIGSKDSIPWYFGMNEQANGLPDLVPYTVPGDAETKWSDVNRNKFLRNMVEQDIQPILRSQNPVHIPIEASNASMATVTDIQVAEPFDDDLPF